MSIYYCEFGTRESKNLIFDYYYSVYLVIFFRKLQNIVRYTILILVQTSRKYLIFKHYIYKYRSIYCCDFGTKKSKILDFLAIIIV